MSHITGGVVSVEDGRKAAEEFSPARKVRVELHFDVPADGDHEKLITGVGDLAHSHVARLLGGAVATKVGPISNDKERLAAAAGVDASAQATAAAPKTRAKPGPKPKNQEAAPPATAAEEAFDPTAPVEAKPAAEQIDLEEVIPAAEKPKEITDAELNNAVQQKNAKLKNPPKIRELIFGFNPDPSKSFQLRQIPQGQRTDFLKKLEALS